MDLKMDAETISSIEHPVWDVKVENGIVPIITGDDEDLQCATLAAFLQQGSIPQLPSVGVPWTEFLTQEISFADIDLSVRGSIMDAGQSEYYPSYDVENSKLIVSIGKDI